MTTRVAILQALRDGPGFGQELVRRVADITGGMLRLSAARVYPCLHSLEREGLLTARRVTPGGKRGARNRTYYELTPRGVEVSTAHRRTLEAMVHRGTPRLPADSRLSAARLVAVDELSAETEALRRAMRRLERRGAR